MTDEQRVRTMAGWIGVEISKSRVRTPGKAGYGLYRVRGSLPVVWSIRRGETEIDRSPGQGQPTLWTPYAFTLPMIRACVEDAIRAGMPDGPGWLRLRAYGHGWSDPADTVVPTRWTTAYQGRRDLGADAPADLGESLSGSTVRSRQRAANAAFQAEHLKRRQHGLQARHAAKLRGNPMTGIEEDQ